MTTMNTNSRAVRKKRIHNPANNTYYAVRVRTTKARNKGGVLGRWSSAIMRASSSLLL